MNSHVVPSLVLSLGLILASGCVSMTPRNPVNATVPDTTTAASAVFSNTTDPGLNRTVNATATIPSDLKGSLRVSISGCQYPVTLPVFLDNINVGTVRPTAPLYMMVREGEHTVMVCANSVCEQETVSIRFGTYVSVDFSERILTMVKFPNPTIQPAARILDYFRNGNEVSVDVEFINPDSTDHTFSIELSIGYTFIDDRTHIKLGDSAQAKTAVFVKAGQTVTERVDIYLSSRGSLVNFGSPVIENIIIK